MEVYDDLASCSSDEEDDYDASYEPSPVSKKAKAALQKSGHGDKENDSSQFLDFLKDGEDGKKVTLEQCKDYLRNHGLRISGTKAVVIERIKGHLQEQKTSANAQPEVPNFSSDPIHDDFIGCFANMDLNHANSLAITALLEDEKKLTVEDCKAYLRKHGLRLAGAKQVLIERIKEHLQIKDNEGLTKYPETTFTINCQGDACIGDVVLFKQKVYEFFNGPPVGIRTIAGRILKESYGSAKQQHTFTVEVLWSAGDRPLPPLHPLIIKGRNLYRVKTLRQAWADEKARTKQLQEKHARGSAARKEQMARIESMKHIRFFKNQTCRTAYNFVGLSGNDSSKKFEDAFTNDGQKAIPLSKTCGNIDAGAKVNPTCLKSTAVYANQKVDTAHMITTHMMSSGYSTSIHARMRADIISATTTTNMVSSHAEPAVSSVELKFNRVLAGLIIGKEGVHCKEVQRISQAELSVEVDAANPALCIVKITGTAHQKDVAIQMVSQRTLCKFFANKGECRHGENCKFSHSLLSG